MGTVQTLEESGRVLLHKLVENKLILVWPKDDERGWTLRSKLWSPFYVDLRGLCGIPSCQEVLEGVGDAFVQLIAEKEIKPTRLAAVATAGIPISTAITMRSGIPTCYTRREKKQTPDGDGNTTLYGQDRYLDGEVLDGDRLLLVDDLITDGSSKIEALGMVKDEATRRGIRLECSDVAVIMDRGLIGEERLRQYGVRLHSLIPLRSKGLEWLRDELPAENIGLIQEYLSDPAPFQQLEYRQTRLADLGASLQLPPKGVVNGK